MNLEFDAWFDVFTDYCRDKLDYHGPIDRETFAFNWQNKEWPEDSARAFVEEMNG